MNGQTLVGAIKDGPEDAISAWCSALLAESLRGPIGRPGEWLEHTCRGLASSVDGMHAALRVETEDDDLAVRAAACGNDDFRAMQWLHELTSDAAPERRMSRLGLSDLRRATAGVRIPGADGVLTIEIAGAEAEWEAPEAVRRGLSIAASMLAPVFERLVVEPSLRRRRIMERLRPTQQELIPHLVTSKSEAEIATRIGRSRHTVHDHTKKIYKALGVNSRMDLAALWNGSATLRTAG